MKTTLKMNMTSKMKTTLKWRWPQKWRRPQKWRQPQNCILTKHTRRWIYSPLCLQYDLCRPSLLTLSNFIFSFFLSLLATKLLKVPYIIYKNLIICKHGEHKTWTIFFKVIQVQTKLTKMLNHKFFFKLEAALSCWNKIISIRREVWIFETMTNIWTHYYWYAIETRSENHREPNDFFSLPC